MAKKKIETPLFAEHGKIPPQAIELEEVVLGAIMLEKDAFEQVNSILKLETFYKEAHQRIYKAIQSLNDKSEPIDILTVTNELKNSGELERVGGPLYITQLTNRIASSANIEFHSRILHQKYIKRELIRVSTDTQKNCFDDEIDVFELVDELELQISNIVNGILTEKIVTFDKALENAREQAIKRGEFYKEGKTVGIKTPLFELTQITAGWKPKELIILAARPSQGKTSFALACADKAAYLGNHVYFSSLETSELSLTNKVILGNSELDANEFRTGSNIEIDKIDNAIKRIKNYNIYFDDIPKSINKIRAKAKKLKTKGMIDLLIVDYIQLIPPEENSFKNSVREQEVSKISRTLKLMAAELDIPVIALAQLNRNVEALNDKKPKLSFLRESGSLEQDADCVLMMYNPTYYGLKENPETHDSYYTDSGKDKRFILVEKQKDGAAGVFVEYYTDESFTKFFDACFEDSGKETIF